MNKPARGVRRSLFYADEYLFSPHLNRLVQQGVRPATSFPRIRRILSPTVTRSLRDCTLHTTGSSKITCSTPLGMFFHYNEVGAL
jgi:hypothetical protein